jgi:formate hydrogenlyase subunit 4
MSFVEAAVAQLLHIVLVLAVAPILAGMMASLAARLAGRDGPPLLQPWSGLRRLLRKQALLPEDSSPLFPLAPAAAFATTAAAAVLVPSFTTGMTFAPQADLLTVATLLWLGRVIMALAAMDTGTAQGGLAAAGVMRLNLLAEPARLLIVLTLALLAGSGNLDLIIDQQREGMLLPGAASALAAAALIALGIVDAPAQPHDWGRAYTGRDLALCRYTEWLRLVVWLDLIGALFLPVGMAWADSGLGGWGLGLAAWLGRLVGFAACLTVSRASAGSIHPASATDMLGIGLLLGVLASVMMLASAGA